jgi:hypothetical protein
MAKIRALSKPVSLFTRGSSWPFLKTSDMDISRGMAKIRALSKPVSLFTRGSSWPFLKTSGMDISRGMAKIGALCKPIVCFAQNSYPSNLLFIVMPLSSMISFLTTLKLEDVHSSKPSVDKHTGWHHILKHSNLHRLCHENLKPQILLHVPDVFQLISLLQVFMAII